MGPDREHYGKTCLGRKGWPVGNADCSGQTETKGLILTQTSQSGSKKTLFLYCRIIGGRKTTKYEFTPEILGKGKPGQQGEGEGKADVLGQASFSSSVPPQDPLRGVVRPRVVGPTAGWWQSLSAAWLWALPLLPALEAQTLTTSSL